MEYLSHALILTGENREKLHDCALAYAKGLNCAVSGENNCTCISCRIFDSGNHPDTFFIKATKQKGIGVEEVREQIVIPMSVKPFKYKYKVFIILDTITPQAQNALLKTIEEPAPYGVFLFLAANTHSFLPTVLSRCVIKNVKGEFSGEADYEPLAEEIIQISQSADIPQAFALYRKVEAFDKEQLQKFLDTLYVSYGKKINSSAFHLLNAPEIITKTKKILSQNGNTQLALELMFYKLAIDFFSN